MNEEKLMYPFGLGLYLGEMLVEEELFQNELELLNRIIAIKTNNDKVGKVVVDPKTQKVMTYKYRAYRRVITTVPYEV